MKDLFNKPAATQGEEPAAPTFDAAVKAAREEMLDRVLLSSGIVSILGLYFTFLVRIYRALLLS